MDTLEADPSSDGRIGDFLGWLWHRKPHLAGVTVCSYVSTLRSHCARLVNWQFRYSIRITQYLTRIKQAPREHRFKLPATKQLVRLVAMDTALSMSVRVAVLLAFNKLLRCSEYCSESASKPMATLLSEHVQWSDQLGCFVIRIARSKSDRTNSGQTVNVYPQPADGAFCPVSAIRQYMAGEPLTKKKGHPFFVRRVGGNPLFVTRLDVTNALKKQAQAAALPVERVSSHSLRIGGAFAMANAGVSMQLIASIGRWSGQSAERMVALYTRMSAGRVVAASGALSLRIGQLDDVPLYDERTFY